MNLNDELLSIEDLAVKFYEAGIIVFGEFTLSSGIKSPYYIDARKLISHPGLLYWTANFLWKVKPQCTLPDLICGVPYGSVPLSTIISNITGLPLLLCRKEKKKHGQGKQVEGIFSENQFCILIEDVITKGEGVLSTAKLLRDVGLIANTVLVLMDREQNATTFLKKHGINVYSLFKISFFIDILTKKNILCNDEKHSIDSYINNILTYEERKQKCHNPLSKTIFEIMCAKKSNLCVALDISKFSDLLEIANIIGPYICMLKIHIDIINDFDQESIILLQKCAEYHNFIILEDRKFADIASIVNKQYSDGVYRISQWAHLVTAHIMPGEGLIHALRSTASNLNLLRGLLIIAQMSSSDSLVLERYLEKAKELSEKYSDFVVGFISQSKVSEDPRMIHITPGINLLNKYDCFDQEYVTPEIAILEKQADIIVVGRGIIESFDIEKVKLYQELGYCAYQKRIRQS